MKGEELVHLPRVPEATALFASDMRALFDAAQAELARREALNKKLAAALDSPELAPTQKQLVKILGLRRGAINAVSSRAISELLGVPYTEHERRWICETIETLGLLHRLPIGASRVQPCGYFLIETPADLDIAISARWKEVYAHMRFLRALTSKQDVERLWGQAQLQLDSESGEEKGYGHGV